MSKQIKAQTTEKKPEALFIERQDSTGKVNKIEAVWANVKKDTLIPKLEQGYVHFILTDDTFNYGPIVHERKQIKTPSCLYPHDFLSTFDGLVKSAGHMNLNTPRKLIDFIKSVNEDNIPKLFKRFLPTNFGNLDAEQEGNVLRRLKNKFGKLRLNGSLIHYVEFEDIIHIP